MRAGDAAGAGGVRGALGRVPGAATLMGISSCSALMLVYMIPPSTAAQAVVEPWDAALHLHRPETVAKFDAKCLDGVLASI